MKKQLLIALTTLGIPALCSAANISLTASDGFNTSSFNSGLNWSDATAPNATNDYFTGDFILRTPPDGGSHTFGGNSLTVNNVNGYPQGLFYKGTGSAGTITINNLILDGGLISHGNGSGDICRIAGNINVLSPSRIDNKQGPIFIDATLSGTGTITNANLDNNDRTTTYTADNSPFTGRMVILNSNCRVTITNENNLGGNPASFTADQLQVDAGWLQTGISNNVVLDDSNRGITLNGSWSLNPQVGSTLTIAVPISGAGEVHKRGEGAVTLSGDNSALSGGVRLGAFSAGSRLNLASAQALGSGIFTVNADANTPILDNTSGADLTLAPSAGQQAWNRSFTFLGTHSLDMASLGLVTMSADVTVTVSNNSLTVGSVFDDGFNRQLTKNGAGTLTLNGGGFYFGDTVVNDGVLALTGFGHLDSPTITLATNGTLDVSGAPLDLIAGQTLAGHGTVLGNVADGAGSTEISPGSSAGTLTIDGNLTLNGGTTLNYELTPTPTVGSGVNDLIVVSGQLTLGNSAGTTTLNILGATGSAVTYTLIQYGSFVGSVANVTVPPGYTLTNNTTTKTIDLISSHIPVNLTWVGDGVLNTWDIGTTPNWNGGAKFFNGDSVTFDNSGNNTVPVSLGSDVSPTSVAVNASQDYTFTGYGIANGSLTKSGSGTLILDNTNSYSGATVVNGGTLQVGNFGVAGTVGSGPITNNGVLQFARAGGDDLVIAANIEGSGSITNIGSSGTVSLNGKVSGTTVNQAGAAGMRLNGSNDYTGLTLVNSGVLYPRNTNALGSTAVGTVVNSGGNLYFDLGQAMTVTGEALTLDGGQLQRGGGQELVYGGPITLAAAGGTISTDGGATITPVAGIGGAGTLTKTGGGTLALTTINSYTGKTIINGGTVQIATLDALGPDPGSATVDYVTFGGGTLAVTNDQTFTGGNRGLAIATSGFLNVGDAAATLTVSGDLNGAGNLSKRGPGTLVLSGSNPWAGAALYLDSTSGANDGITRVASPSALANLTVSPGLSTIFQGNNNAGWSTLQLDGSGGSITLAQDWDMNCRNNDNPNVQNVAGNNTLSGTIHLNVGGNRVIFQSDAGQLTISGNQQYVGTLTGGRTYTFAGAGDILVSGVINNSTNGAPISVAKRGTGTTTLSAANTYANTTTISEGVLNVTGSLTSTGGVFVAGGALAGNGTVNDHVTVTASSPSGTIDNYAVSGNYTINGYHSVDVNRAGFVSDQPVVAGTVNNNGSSVLLVNNLGAPLQVGDTFTLFNKTIAGGTMAVSGGGVTWTYNGTLAQITVASTTVAQPTIGPVSVGGGNVTLTGSGGPANGAFLVVSSTDVSVPLANWTVEGYSSFDGSGNFSVLVPVNAADPQKFYAIDIP